MRLSICILLVLSVANSWGASPQDQSLIQDGDITHIGYFSLPSAWGSQSGGVSGGGRSLAVSSDGTMLYVGGHSYYDTIGRVVIPTVFDGRTATQDVSLTEVPGTVGSSGTVVRSGALVYNNRLIVQKYLPYDGSNATMASHAACDTSISNCTAFTPISGLGSQTIRQTNQYMGIVPTDWAVLVGYPAFTGAGQQSINAGLSWGPSMYGFDPDTVTGSGTITGRSLIAYSITNPLASTYPNQYTTPADMDNAGMFWPTNTRSILFVGGHGLGKGNYKCALFVSPCDPSCGGEDYYGRLTDGGIGTGYRRQVTAFDANDVLRVIAGTIQPYQVTPYAYWTLPSQNTNECAEFEVGGLAYDDVNRRLFVAEMKETMRIDVYSIAGGTAAQNRRATGGGKIAGSVH